MADMKCQREMKSGQWICFACPGIWSEELSGPEYRPEGCVDRKPKIDVRLSSREREERKHE